MLGDFNMDLCKKIKIVSIFFLMVFITTEAVFSIKLCDIPAFQNLPFCMGQKRPSGGDTQASFLCRYLGMGCKEVHDITTTTTLDICTSDGTMYQGSCWYKAEPGSGKSCTEICYDRGLVCVQPDWDSMPQNCELYEAIGIDCSSKMCREATHGMVPYSTDYMCYYRTDDSGYDCDLSGRVVNRVCACEVPSTPLTTTTTVECISHSVPDPCKGFELCGLISCWGRKSSDENWTECSQYDYDGDCNVDILDISRCMSNLQRDSELGSYCKLDSDCNEGLNCDLCYSNKDGNQFGECTTTEVGLESILKEVSRSEEISKYNEPVLMEDLGYTYEGGSCVQFLGPIDVTGEWVAWLEGGKALPVSEFCPEYFNDYHIMRGKLSLDSEGKPIITGKEEIEVGNYDEHPFDYIPGGTDLHILDDGTLFWQKRLSEWHRYIKLFIDGEVIFLNGEEPEPSTFAETRYIRDIINAGIDPERGRYLFWMKRDRIYDGRPNGLPPSEEYNDATVTWFDTGEEWNLESLYNRDDWERAISFYPILDGAGYWFIVHDSSGSELKVKKLDSDANIVNEYFINTRKLDYPFFEGIPFSDKIFIVSGDYGRNTEAIIVGQEGIEKRINLGKTVGKGPSDRLLEPGMLENNPGVLFKNSSGIEYFGGADLVLFYESTFGFPRTQIIRPGAGGREYQFYMTNISTGNENKLNMVLYSADYLTYNELGYPKYPWYDENNLEYKYGKNSIFAQRFTSGKCSLSTLIEAVNCENSEQGGGSWEECKIYDLNIDDKVDSYDFQECISSLGTDGALGSVCKDDMPCGSRLDCEVMFEFSDGGHAGECVLPKPDFIIEDIWLCGQNNENICYRIKNQGQGYSWFVPEQKEEFLRIKLAIYDQNGNLIPADTYINEAEYTLNPGESKDSVIRSYDNSELVPYDWECLGEENTIEVTVNPIRDEENTINNGLTKTFSCDVQN